MISFLQNYQEENQVQENLRESVNALPVLSVQEGAMPPGRSGRRRVGISAETRNDNEAANIERRVIDKSDAERAQIRSSVANNILFNSLDEDQYKIVIDAMEKKEFKQGDWIIKQGEDGNEFYVVQQGTCETFINIDGQPKMVKKYNHGESFGELALMYNTPRAASIQAASERVTLWAMDRATFQYVLQSSTSEKRKKYEDFLRHVSVFSSLDNYERAKIADAVVERAFKAGEYILSAGDTNDTSFYILLDGTCVATKVLDGSDTAQEVMRYKPGDYFGELALLSSAPRAANVIAQDDVRVISLDRDAFERLLGPCMDILKRDKDKYSEMEAKLQGSK